MSSSVIKEGICCIMIHNPNSFSHLFHLILSSPPPPARPPRRIPRADPRSPQRLPPQSSLCRSVFPAKSVFRSPARILLPPSHCPKYLRSDIRSQRTPVLRHVPQYSSDLSEFLEYIPSGFLNQTHCIFNLLGAIKSFAILSPI